MKKPNLEAPLLLIPWNHNFTPLVLRKGASITFPNHFLEKSYSRRTFIFPRINMNSREVLNIETQKRTNRLFNQNMVISTIWFSDEVLKLDKENKYYQFRKKEISILNGDYKYNSRYNLESQIWFFGTSDLLREFQKYLYLRKKSNGISSNCVQYVDPCTLLHFSSPYLFNLEFINKDCSSIVINNVSKDLNLCNN